MARQRDGQKGEARDQRIQDAIHGIIDFHPERRTDRIAWRLLQTPDFQRLRRIKQLGAAEYVFPSASHSRFAHSIGVFHSARRLVERMRRELETGHAGGAFDEGRAEAAVLAALLHDIGHGPFSHVFERARKAVSQDAVAGEGNAAPLKTHEEHSAAMIRSDAIGAILAEEELDAENIAQIVCAKPPQDMYHAIVSGTFDADRMDYMMRDKYMTGIGEGGFDTNWIMDNIRVARQGGEHSFCLAHKALTAAEEFLLGRFHLHKDIYLHKTIRAMECLLERFFLLLAREAAEEGRVCGLDEGHPLARFLAGGEGGLDAYRALDDTAVGGTLHAIAGRASGGSASLESLAQRVLERRVPACIDVAHRFPEQPQRQVAFKEEITSRFQARMGASIFFDSPPLSLYEHVGDDAERRHERLLIQLPNGELREITEISDSILAGRLPLRRLERCYFLDDGEYEEAERLAEKMNGRG